MDEILIVDGSNLMFQMFYGMPARITNSEGKAIQGVLGFVGALLKIIRKLNPTHVVVLFDGEYKSDRTLLYEGYKANREELSDGENSPFSQMDDIKNALDFLGIRYAETDTCEADDWISSYVKQYSDKNKITIVSQDSDFFQLISQNVCVLRYRGDNSVICDEKYIEEKLGIKPCDYALFKSLTGDNSDNIKGVYGIGPKTAAQIANSFSDIDSLICNIEKIQKKSVCAALYKSIDRLKLNFKLICLDRNCDIPFNRDEMLYEYNGITTTEVLRGIGLK